MKSDDGKSCLIPDKIKYNLAESFKQKQNIVSIDLFVLSVPSEETKYELNVFRTEIKEYLPINRILEKR